MALNPCQKARAHFSDELDGEPLPLPIRVLVRLHLWICPPCRRAHRSLEATCDALHALRDAEVDEEETSL